MANLFASIHNASRAMQAFQDAVGVSQNNVNNASTPGYVRQRVNFVADLFAPSEGLSGGVTMGRLESARNQFAERLVQRYTASQGGESARASALAPLEAEFDVTGQSGISAALKEFSNAISAWGAAPNDATGRERVINQAEVLAASFRDTSTRLVDVAAQVEADAQNTVTSINALAARIRDLNQQRRQGAQDDPGLDAQMHAALEELSSYSGFSTLTQADGAVSVTLDGGTPLVLGDSVNELSVVVASQGSADPPLSIIDQQGHDVTAQISRGKLAGLLSVRNTTIASVVGGGGRAGSLNELAKALADEVNAALQSGTTTIQGVEVPGVPLFAYDSTDPTATAQSLKLATGISASKLAAKDPLTNVMNAIPLRLSGLAESYSSRFGSIAAGVGQDLQSASDNRSRATDLLNQSRDLRSQASGVSLDEEAARLVELQRAYQANARTFQVLSDLTETVIGLIR
jgi:flagellar hook-associated protein 1